MLEIPEYGERKEGDEVMDQIRQDTYEDLVDLCDILESISIVRTSRSWQMRTQNRSLH